MIYTKNNQRLTIKYDDSAESPRKDSNLGFFITQDRNYHSPDKNEDFQNIIKETAEKASSTEDHMKLIKKEIKSRTDEKVVAIYPICKYEHSGVNYSLGRKEGFDYSNNGFYIITERSAKEIGTPKKSFEKVIKQELTLYNQWCEGEIFGFILEEKQPDCICKECGHNSGNDYKEIDSCWGFYSTDDIFESICEKQEDWELINDNM